jgi:hypothetical protein
MKHKALRRLFGVAAVLEKNDADEEISSRQIRSQCRAFGTLGSWVGASLAPQRAAPVIAIA